MKHCTKCGIRKSLETFAKNMWSWGRDKVLAEIAKCELVCANCHRIRTHTQTANEAAA